jgi:hypothetical protein
VLPHIRTDFRTERNGDRLMTVRQDWPLAARLIARLAQPQDKGLGDTIERIAAKRGGDWFKAAHKAITGADCGCPDRQANLNEKFPY